MKESKNISWRITLAIMLIFGLGFTLGKVTSMDRLAKIEGYKIKIEQDALAIVDDATSGNATSSDVDDWYDEDYATDPNATSSNADDWYEEDYATNPNATSSNADDWYEEDYATDSNATSSNAEPEDDTVITDPIRVELDNKEKIELKNGEITSDHIAYIRTSTKDVIVDATNDTIISKSLLSAISAVSKNILVVNSGDNQFVFYGSKIQTIPDVTDVKVVLEKVDLHANISELVPSKQGVVIVFKEGNKFPDGTIVRIKATDFVKQQITTDAKVYSFDETTRTYKLVQTNIGLEDEYYNLKIDGDTKYLLINKDVELTNIGTTNENKEVVEFIDSNMTYLLVIAGSVVVILVVSVMLISNRKKQEIKIDTPITSATDDKPIQPQTVVEDIPNVIEEKK